MVLALVRPIIAVASQVFKHRKAIYAVLTAQDRYISSAFRYGGYGKATSYGVRSGALAGSVIGAFINNAEDSPGDAVPQKIQQSTPGKQNQTRGRRTGRNSSRYATKRCYGPRGRNSRFSKY